MMMKLLLTNAIENHFQPAAENWLTTHSVHFPVLKINEL